MALVPYLTPDDLAEDDRKLLAYPANLFRAMANSTDALKAFLRLGGWASSGSALDARLRELVVLTVARAAGGDYEWAHHAHDAVEGEILTSAEVHALGAGTEVEALTAEERLAVRAAHELTVGGRFTPATAVELGATLDPGQIVDLVVTVGFYVFVSRVGSGLELELEDRYSAAALR